MFSVGAPHVMGFSNSDDFPNELSMQTGGKKKDMVAAITARCWNGALAPLLGTFPKLAKLWRLLRTFRLAIFWDAGF
ncbi:hypothetical protein MRB53_008750 [Persea americana]|uniref:Uncharacterized protein n=1 Tax=Persea americana TaxID=3435 RepID=A0ACC2LMU7_PERAE|nr:hypothetical protein MRB53_008750 [Persea americana]